jgi:hypothetical protein
LNRKPEEIYWIDCWRHVIHAVKGISRFVSYADLPSVLGVELPTQKKYAPKFWVHFCVQKFMQVVAFDDLVAWRELIGTIKQVILSRSIANST